MTLTGQRMELLREATRLGVLADFASDARPMHRTRLDDRLVDAEWKRLAGLVMDAKAERGHRRRRRRAA